MLVWRDEGMVFIRTAGVGLESVDDRRRGGSLDLTLATNGHGDVVVMLAIPEGLTCWMDDRYLVAARARAYMAAARSSAVADGGD